MRPTIHDTFMEMAYTLAKRTTCLRRGVGCVLVNARGHVLATGYNGVAKDQMHCNHEVISSVTVRNDNPGLHDVKTEYPHACPGANLPSGQGLDQCHAIHAEQNALLQCHNVHEIETCYVTVAPCVTCVKLLLNTSCKKIIFGQPYSHSEAEKMWTTTRHTFSGMDFNSGRDWFQSSYIPPG